MTINGTEVAGQSAGNVGREEFHSGWIKVSDRPTVVFENQVRAGALRTLSIQKKLFDESGQPLYDAEDATTFSFRLYLSNGSDDTLKLANMYRYYVKDRDGNYCQCTIHNLSTPPVGYADSPLKEGAIIRLPL